MKRILQLIIIFLLLAIYGATSILLKEMKNQMKNMDYTIYTFEEPVVYRPREEKSPILKDMLLFFEDVNKERKYKYYKKLELTNYCNCDECRLEWVWGPSPSKKPLIPELAVAANPKTFAIGTHIKISEKEFIVYYNDEKIPVDKIYVYVNKHDRKNKTLYNGIWDVYKEKS